MAGVDVGTAYLTVVPSAKGFAGKLQNELGGPMGTAGTKAGDTASKGFGGKFKAGMATAGKAGALALVAAMAVGVKAVASAVSAASDLQQSTGGVEAIFGKQAAGIKKSAEAAALGLGLSKNSYQELASTLGAGLKNKGIKDFSDTSQNLIGIGADLSAQFGGSTKDAVEAISSAMRGESDPIERYGVSLNETAVSAELVAKGQSKLTGKALDQAKAMARISIITKQTKDAQGAFGRESETLAGKQERLKATWQNMKAELGTKLLPVLTKLAGWFLDKGLPAIQRFGGWISDKLWPALKEGWKTILPGIQKALSIVTGGVGEGTVSWKKIGDVLTTKVIPFVSKLISIYLPALAVQIRVAIEVVKALWKVFQTLMGIVSGVVTFILRRFADMSEMWAGVLRALSHVPGFGWAADAAKKLDKAAGKANDVARAIDNINKDVKIKVGFQQTGRITLPNGKQVNLGMRAGGGPVAKNKPYAVGDNPDGSWNRTTELFVPDRSGTVFNQDQLAGMSRGGSTGSDLSRADLQLLVAAVESANLRANISVGSADRALGGSLR